MKALPQQFVAIHTFHKPFRFEVPHGRPLSSCNFATGTLSWPNSIRCT